MSVKQGEIDETLTNVHLAVVGNKEYGHKGLVSEVAELREYVDKDKMMKSKVVGGLAVVGILWTLLLEFWKNIFTK